MTNLSRITSFALILFAFAVQPALSSEEGHPERVMHYEFEQPKTSEEAKALYERSMGEVDVVLKKKSLDINDLEDVHRISYALEAAVETFEKQHTYDKELTDEVEHGVEELHEYSEEHKEEETRAWFAKLTELSTKLQ